MISKTTKAWIEATRIRTLPVSTAGVLSAWALAIHFAEIRWLPAIICLLFAILCQIASNFANEYYDFRDGLDKKGRSGPRRGVTEGDLSASAMKTATYSVLFIASLLGFWLIYWGGMWLILVGIFIVLGALAYSTGPYPLSRNGLGETAVMVFFGLIPVNMTYYLATGSWEWRVLFYSLAIGAMGSNVLMVNNFRDADDDRAVGKRTLANILGRTRAREIYLWNGLTAFIFACIGAWGYNILAIAPVIYILVHLSLWSKLNLYPGENPSVLNPLLGKTAALMLLFAGLLFA